MKLNREKLRRMILSEIKRNLYEGLDTQEKCHPNLTVKLGDLAMAKEKIIQLKLDKDYYKECSKIAKLNYKQYYYEERFISQIRSTSI